MDKFFKTISSRILFICLIVSIIMGLVYQYSVDKPLNPTNWYFVTTESNSVDIRSPTRKKIIIMQPKKYFDSSIYIRECDLANLSNNGSDIAKQEYRSLELCNINGKSRDEFTTRSKYFMEMVDELWTDYYYEYSGMIILGLLKGCFAWLIMVGFFIVARWAIRGKV